VAAQAVAVQLVRTAATAAVRAAAGHLSVLALLELEHRGKASMAAAAVQCSAESVAAAVQAAQAVHRQAVQCQAVLERLHQ
jgi:hypothetical protein